MHLLSRMPIIGWPRRGMGCDVALGSTSPVGCCRRHWLAVIALFVAVFMLAGCARDHDSRNDLDSSAEWPDPIQMPPDAPVAPLEAAALARSTDAALASEPIRSFLEPERVSRIIVQAGDGSTFGVDEAVWVFFEFREAHSPSSRPWQELCDIGSQSEAWLGVVAIVLEGGSVSSSPLWKSGTNCVSWFPSAKANRARVN